MLLQHHIAILDDQLVASSVGLPAFLILKLHPALDSLFKFQNLWKVAKPSMLIIVKIFKTYFVISELKQALDLFTISS